MNVTRLPRTLAAALMGRCCAAAALSAAMLAPAAAQTGLVDALTDPAQWEAAHWRGLVAPYAPHWRPSPEHRYVWAVGAERQRADNWMAGTSLFSNSFGQPSAYVYLGKRFPGLLGQEQLFGQLSGGVLYGYVGKYKNKVPMNVNGFSPGALFSLGWQFNREVSLTAHMYGDAGMMFQVGWDFK